VQDLLKRIAGPRLWQILHPDAIDEAAISPERADELRAKWGTASGQLWQAGPHCIMCGNCIHRSALERLFGDDRRLPVSLISTHHRLAWIRGQPACPQAGRRDLRLDQNGRQLPAHPLSRQGADQFRRLPGWRCLQSGENREALPERLNRAAEHRHLCRTAPKPLSRNSNTHLVTVTAPKQFDDSAHSSTPLYVDEVVQEAELVVRQAGAPLGAKARLAAKVAAPPLALSPNGCKGRKSRIARRGKSR
jgi:hypothetical protein